MQGKKQDAVYVGFRVNALSRKVRSCMHQLVEEQEGIPESVAKYGWMIGYIAQRSDQDTYQKDLEAVTNLSKASITGALQTLEKSGLIRRVSVEQDARLKKIEVTDEGQKFVHRSMDRINRIESVLQRDVDPEDLKIFCRVMDQMEKNMQ